MPLSQPSTSWAEGYAPKLRAAIGQARQQAKRKTVKKASFVAASILAAILAAVGGGLAGFAVPGTPKSTPSLAFAGFIHLPRVSGVGILSALDYLTVNDRTLFVASIRPGAIYRVPLREGALPRTSDVTALDGGPSAHGVAFDPDSQLGFVSRSGANTVDVFDPRTMQVLHRIPVDEDVDAILFDPSSKLVYAASGSPSLATLIHPVTASQCWNAPARRQPRIRRGRSRNWAALPKSCRQGRRGCRGPYPAVSGRPLAADRMQGPDRHRARRGRPAVVRGVQRQRRDGGRQLGQPPRYQVHRGRLIARLGWLRPRPAKDLHDRQMGHSERHPARRSRRLPGA